MKYKYSVYTKDKKVKSGILDAVSQEAAKKTLLMGGFPYVLTLKEIRFKNNHSNVTGFFKQFSITSIDIMEFTRELSYLLEAGVSIYSALQLLSRQTKKQSLKAVIEDIAISLNAGKSFSQAISKYPRYFSSMYCEVMSTAEKSGELNVGLNYLTEYIEKQEAVKKRVRRALTYPAVIVAFAAAIGALMATVVMPPLVALFESVGTNLPLTTKIVLVFSNFIIDNKFYILLGFIVLPIITCIYTGTKSGKENKDRLLLNIPSIGQIILKTNLMRFTYTSSVLLKAGLQISKVLSASARSITNIRIRTAIDNANISLLEGRPLSQVIAGTGMFPESSIEMLAVGEKTGNLDVALNNISNYLERNVTNAIDDLVSMIEPTLTIGIGIVIGLIAISIITPIYTLAGSMP